MNLHTRLRLAKYWGHRYVPDIVDIPGACLHVLTYSSNDSAPNELIDRKRAAVLIEYLYIEWMFYGA